MLPVAGALVIVLFCVVGAKVAYETLWSPLRKIPGPFLAKLSPRWISFIDLAGFRTLTIHQLHQKYGKVVRIGPQELSFADTDSVKEIYSQTSQFMKAPIYDSMSVKPPGIFSLRNKEQHRDRRRLLSNAFSQSNLNRTEPLIAENIRQLLVHLRSNPTKPKDVFVLFRLLALDIVGDLFLGESFHALPEGHVTEFLHDIDCQFQVLGIEWSFPWIYKILWKIPLPRLQHFLHAPERVSKCGHDAFAEYMGRYGRSTKRIDLLTKIITQPNGQSEKSGSALSDYEIGIEIGNLVFAGTDTTSNTLTYLFWELTKHEEWQERLQAELDSLPLDNGVVSFKAITDLPVLDAVVNESLRVHPAAPASLPRETPKGGSVLAGYFVPGGTIVSTQCYTTHRDPKMFPDPEAFDPSRWLDSKQTAEWSGLFMPFSKGTRACIGKGLAIMELKLVVATVIKQYSVSLAPDMTDEDMDMVDHFLIIPKGGKCNLLFHQRVLEKNF